VITWATMKKSIDAASASRCVLERDGGNLYFFIPEDALVAHDWSAVRCVLQCSRRAATPERPPRSRSAAARRDQRRDMVYVRPGETLLAVT
jgi:hypothetical protein